MPDTIGRSPHGERGLKFLGLQREKSDSQSLPARGAWIEMLAFIVSSSRSMVAPRTGSVD